MKYWYLEYPLYVAVTRNSTIVSTNVLVTTAVFPDITMKSSFNDSHSNVEPFSPYCGRSKLPYTSSSISNDSKSKSTTSSLVISLAKIVTS